MLPVRVIDAVFADCAPNCSFRIGDLRLRCVRMPTTPRRLWTDGTLTCPLQLAAESSRADYRYFWVPVVCERSPVVLLSPPRDPASGGVLGGGVSRSCVGRALLGLSPCVFGCGSAGVCGCCCAKDEVASVTAAKRSVALRTISSSSVHAPTTCRKHACSCGGTRLFQVDFPAWRRA